jgi:N-acetyl sugar amidotransferase
VQVADCIEFTNNRKGSTCLTKTPMEAIGTGSAGLGRAGVPLPVLRLRHCHRCGLPETYETIEFDAKGVCNMCLQKDFKDGEIDWVSRRVSLEGLIEKYRGRHDYDCIVPFSGGKDSTYTLNYLVKEFGVKPLVVQFDHGFMRPQLRENNERTFRRLGVEVVSFRPNWELVKRVMLESLVRKGDFCWHCHTGIFAYPMHVALKFKTPLIFWGEPSSEYSAYYDYRDDEVEEVDETRFNRFVNLGITAEDMAGMIAGDFEFDPRDLTPFTYPKKRDLRRLGVRSVCLGSYIPWDVKENVAEIHRDLGWEGDEVENVPFHLYPYEKIECWMQGVRDYIKYLKRGYSRLTQMTALDLRNQRIDKRSAEDLIAEYENRRPPSLDLFLEYLGLSEKEFNEIVLKTAVAPFNADLSAVRRGSPTSDFSTWYRES